MAEVGGRDSASSGLAARLHEHWVAPALLLLICLLSYGLWIPWLGAYWDDWYTIWAAETGGAARVAEGLADERPLHGWLYGLTSAIYAVTPAGLHLLVLAARWTSGVAAWWTVRAIWPERRLEALAVALLIVVYPGFSQQSLALSYSNQFITLTFFLISLGGMLWALRRPRFGLLMGIALLSAIPAHWVMEYWLGLELLRWPLALWVTASGVAARERLKRATLVTAPFYANVVVKVLWTVLFLERDGAVGDSLSGYLAAILRNPVDELRNRLGYALTDFADAIVFAWTRALRPEMLDMRLRFVLAAVLLVLLAAALTALFMRWADRPGEGSAVDGAASRDRWPLVAMALGVAGLVTGQLPMWITNRHIEWDVVALDRHSLSAMVGAAIFTVGFLRLLLHRRRAFILVVGLLVGVGASFQFRQGHAYVREHEQQASFFWQMHWRAPGLEPGTTLFLHHDPLSLPQPKDYTYGVPLNLAYDPGYEAGPVKYWLFPDAAGFPPYWLMLLSGGDDELQRRIHGLSLAGSGSAGDADFKRQVHNLLFLGSTDRSIVLLHRAPACLRVLDARRDEVVDLPPMIREARLRSRPELIRPSGRHSVSTLQRFYGPEPDHGWCYYYQKAELGRQTGEWGRVAELADAVLELGASPADAREWTPFIEAYVRVGRYDDAERLVREVVPYRGSIWNVHDRYARHRAFCDLRRRLSVAGLLDAPAGGIFDLAEDGILSCTSSAVPVSP